MTDSSLQDRLREHAKAFDGLLSLIPAKMYYGEDHSDQWNRKKQTKAEAKAARMSKLDPDSDLNRNAKEIMDERAKNKRKLQELEEADNADHGDIANKHHNEAINGDVGGDAEEADKADEGETADGIPKEAPGEGMKRKVPAPPNKKQKVDGKFEGDEPLDSLASVYDADPTNMTQDQLMRMAKVNAKKAERKAKQERQAEKRAVKKVAKEAAAAERAEKKSRKKEEEEAQKEKKQLKAADEKSGQPTKQQQKAKGKAREVVTTSRSDPDRDEDYETVSGESDAEEDYAAAESSKVSAPKSKASTLGDKATDSTASSPRSASGSPVFDTSSPSDAAAAAATNNSGQPASASTDPASTTTSINSTVPPSEKPKHIKIPQDTSALKARLAARIAELQAARKAIGPDGKPIRTRQELIEAQRARQAQRKAHKKEQRQKAKQEEERQRDEALASNSPSIMSPALDHLLADDNEGQEEPADYSFGRVVFNDDTKLSRDLSHALNNHKKKGPSDPKTALLRLQNQKKKHAALDKDKQEDIAEKEAWLAARRRAEGERIKNDEAMLKKTIKRKDKQKKRSEKEWKERSEGVQRAGREKQKKREENLKKRRDDKKLGKAGKAVKGVKVGKKKGGAAGGGGKKGGRPGFEGSFGGMGGKKKK